MFSMTGMGRAKAKIDGSFYLVEIKAVNHRYCEVNTRLPSRLQGLEIQLASLVKSKISRGKVDLWIGEEKKDGAINFNQKALKNYYQLLLKAKNEAGLKEEITLSHLQAGSNFWMNKDLDSEENWGDIKKLVEKALSNLILMRKTEGIEIKKNILARVKTLEELTFKVEKRKASILEEYQKKLMQRIDKLLNQVELDQAKLANEIAFFADKSDVSEEIDRLKIHYQHLKKLMNQKNIPIGRSLDFLIQEINREWNTLSSKTSDAKVAHDVVLAKSELEKIREQVQNIE